jgi:alkylated DNA repair dioxygenase AlkB
MEHVFLFTETGLPSLFGSLEAKKKRLDKPELYREPVLQLFMASLIIPRKFTQSSEPTYRHLCWKEIDGSVSLLIHIKGALSRLQQQALFQELEQIPDSAWIEKRNPFSPEHEILRLNRWHHVDHVPYKFSGKSHDPVPYSPHVERLQNKLHDELPQLLKEWTTRYPKDVHATPCNSVLINKYRHGNDSVSAHADDERAFGPQPTIASLSLGVARKFVVRRMSERQREAAWKNAKSRGRTRPFISNPDYRSETHTFELHGGDLVFMAGSMQEFWNHEITKAPGSTGVRYNLTFRTFSSPHTRQTWPPYVTLVDPPPPKQKRKRKHSI